jgi:magnesium-transporting ATPase (P-type)
LFLLWSILFSAFNSYIFRFLHHIKMSNITYTILFFTFLFFIIMRQRDLNPQPTVKSRALYQLSYPPFFAIFILAYLFNLYQIFYNLNTFNLTTNICIFMLPRESNPYFANEIVCPTTNDGSMELFFIIFFFIFCLTFNLIMKL